MKCPFCGEEMQQGKLRTRGENYFVPIGCKTPMLYTKKSIEKAGAIPVSTDAIGASCEENWNTIFCVRSAESILQIIESIGVSTNSSLSSEIRCLWGSTLMKNALYFSSEGYKNGSNCKMKKVCAYMMRNKSLIY